MSLNLNHCVLLSRVSVQNDATAVGFVSVCLSVTVTRRLKLPSLLHSRPRSLLCQSVLAMHSSVLRAASGGDSRLVRRPISVNKIFGTTKLRYELETAHFH